MLPFFMKRTSVSSPKDHADGGIKARDGKPKEQEAAKPSQWFSPQYIIYILIAIVVFPTVFVNEAVKMGEDYGPGKKNAPRVVKGWFFGRDMDLSDHQWRMWRQYFPLLAGGILIFLLVSNWIKKMRKPEDLSVTSYKRSAVAPSLLFYNLSSIGLIVYIHGADVFWLYFISYVNYLIAKTFKGSKLTPLLVWIWNPAMLFLSNYYPGFKGFFTAAGLPFLEKHHGIFSWHVYFKMSMLRNISFAMDYYWTCNDTKPYDRKGKELSEYDNRVEAHLPLPAYGLPEYFAYVYYVPFFMAGPLATFNAFVSQIYAPQRTYPFLQIVRMTVMAMLYMLGLEIWLHFFYHNCFNEYGLWRSQNFTPMQICLTGFWTLNFMYTKFLIIWRFFRCVGLFDGIESPENMNRCVDNNFTFQGFWRSWHASLNQWIIRYIYVPLGGRKTQVATIWVIFTFVGLWHDLNMRWLAWALCNCVFFSFEIVVMLIFGSKKFSWWHAQPFWRNIVATAGAFNIFLLMCANLAILHGFEYTPLFMKKAFGSDGGFTLAIAAFFMYVGVMFMLEIREGEKRAMQAKKF